MQEKMKASEFKARCLKVMDEVARSGRTVIITKNGEPVAQLTPVVRKRASLIGLHRGQVVSTDDLVAPVDVSWEADGDADS